MFLIRKINKPMLEKLNPTTDIILSVTNTGELFVNNQNGDQLKITDIEVVSDINELATIVPVAGKLYFIKEDADLRLYVSAEKGYISLKDKISEMINDVSKNVTTLDSKIEELTNTVGENKKELETSIGELETNINSKIDTLTSTIQSIQQTVTDNGNSIKSINTTLDEVNKMLPALQTKINDNLESINSIRERVTTNEKNISDLSNGLASNTQTIGNVSEAVSTNTTDISALKETTSRHTDEIAGLNTKVSIKDYHAVFDVNKLKQARIEPEIYVPSYIFNTTEKMFVTKMSLRSRTSPVEAITFELKYVPELADGSVGEEVDLTEITLGAGQYIVTKELDKTYAENKGYDNGYIVAYVKDPGANHSEATLMLDLCVRVPM